MLRFPQGADPFWQSRFAERGQLQSVVVVDNGRAHMRLITLGQKMKDRLEVLSGLSAGDRLIFPVPRDLADGARVEVRP